MKFVHADDHVQLAYSATRRALGEWQNWPTESGGTTWHFLGWLYEGDVRSERAARKYVKRYLKSEGSA